MKKKYVWWTVAAVVVIAGAIYGFGRSKKKTEAELIVKVVQGEFEVLVAVTGELQAKNSENIVGPDLRSGVFRYGDYKIQDLVAEGTVVDSGDYVAEIDRSTAGNSLLDVEDAIEKADARCLTIRLDTTMTLQGLRDELLNKTFAVEEAGIKLEQSKFEPPATIRQAEIDLDKARRALEQAHVNYALKVQQSKANMNEADLDLARQQRRRQQMLDLLSGFTIKAPKKGMVIYYREWSGQKRKIGSSINPWDNIVATLPDLSVMISKTYVNEIDISKIKRGQKVRIGVDAFPDKNYTGMITSVADIGEQLANADAKVFEVVIQVNETDPIMRPSMTTSNSIVINTLSNVTYIPIDAIYSQDSVPFVYTTSHTRQVVILGESNENEIVVEQGLSAGDKVYVSIPENSATWKMTGEDLIPIIKQRALEKKQAEEEKERKAEEEKKARQQRRPGGPPQGGQRQGEQR
ncbi:MAG: HlyD family efflux transporter periplasmic adaptor subunit [Bacteroidales bacterium]|jgi:multidrug efflux pump subunit AcrA (membrane-fusion protein)|nr:HlyD family efflux transporter periplasmic adaptor subunit [Bacteroidales bacterium]